MARDLKCPACGADKWKEFLGDKDLMECSLCALVFDRGAAWDRDYYEHERVSAIDEGKLRARRRNVLQRARLCERVLRKDSRLLDIGCGEGLFLMELRRRVAEVIGLEPTLKYVDYAKRELNLNVRQGVIEEADFPAGHFDVITMFHVLEHLEDPAKALKRISSWLKPGGHLIIEVPNIKSPTAVYRGLNWELIIPEHRLYFAPRSLSCLLERAGFKTVFVKSRDFDQYRGSMGKSLRKLGLSFKKPLNAGERQTKKRGDKARERKLSLVRRIRKGAQLPLEAMLGWMVLGFNRGDHLFAIFRKG